MSRHILITGGAGFIGSHLVDTMLARGCEVTVLDSLSPQVHGDAELDADGWPVYLDPRARRIKGDLLDEGVFERAIEGVTHLAHLAASVGVGQSMANIVGFTRNNVMTAAMMLETLSRKPHTIERIAVASSMSIYGEGAYTRRSGSASVFPKLRTNEQLLKRQWELVEGDETLTPLPTSEEKLLQPASIYAVNKRDHEEMFLSVGRALGIPTMALRLFNAYGSRQALSNPYTGVAAIFISRLLNDRPPLIFEDGEQRRDFVHVQDVAEAFGTVLDSDLCVWDAYNVGSGRPITVAEMANVLARLLHKNIAPQIMNRYRVGDIRHCYADISKIGRVFGFRPRRSLEAGMAELIDWVATTKVPVNRSQECLAELQRHRLVV
jgi:dTDP-L-rhamnose 4-epimerase